MKNTWLVQRLKKPYPSNDKLSELSNAFAFGGGYKNGGLTDEAMNLLSPIFSFDYMGCAEFEFGAIPKFFSNIWNNVSKYTTWTVEIYDTKFYVIGLSEFKEQISTRIKELADRKLQLKAGSCVDVACGKSTYTKKEDCKYIGWLELENEFMFFSDETAFNKTAELYGFVK